MSAEYLLETIRRADDALAIGNPSTARRLLREALRDPESSIEVEWVYIPESRASRVHFDKDVPMYEALQAVVQKMLAPGAYVTIHRVEDGTDVYITDTHA